MSTPTSDSGGKPKSRTVTEVKNWISEATTSHIINQQEKIINFLLFAYGGLLIATTVIFYLQGLKAWGFNLESGLLKWLGGATIGEIAGLLTLTIGALFKKPK